MTTRPVPGSAAMTDQVANVVDGAASTSAMISRADRIGGLQIDRMAVDSSLPSLRSLAIHRASAWQARSPLRSLVTFAPGATINAQLAEHAENTLLCGFSVDRRQRMFPGLKSRAPGRVTYNRTIFERHRAELRPPPHQCSRADDGRAVHAASIRRCRHR